MYHFIFSGIIENKYPILFAILGLELILFVLARDWNERPVINKFP